MCGFLYFVLVSAALAAFYLVLYGFGLVSACFPVFCGFMYFVLVSAALAAFCSVLYGFGLVFAGSAILSGFIVLRWSRLLSLRFVWFCIVLGWSMAVSLL